MLVVNNNFKNDKIHALYHFYYLCTQKQAFMKLKKLIPELASSIINLGFDKEPREVQSVSIPKIKSGSDMYIIGPKGCGKSTALLMGVIQQLKEPFEEAPRAIVVVATKDEAFRMEELFQSLAGRSQLRSFVAFEPGIIQYQKDEIYDGLDVLFVTPKRLTELVNINGIPMTKVKMLIVDDADEFFKSSLQGIFHRIADGLKNPQIIISSDNWISKFDEVEEMVMKNPAIIEIEEE